MSDHVQNTVIATIVILVLSLGFLVILSSNRDYNTNQNQRLACVNAGGVPVEVSARQACVRPGSFMEIK